MIDEFFTAEIDVVENGISRRISNFEAIVLQLWRKAVTATSKRAVKVLLKYLEFAASRGGRPVFALEVVPDKDSGEKNG
jgi:anti-sigma-K factor RskA